MVCFFKQFTGYDWLVMIFDDDKLLLSLIVFLFVGKEIRRISFLLHQIPAIFLIADDAENHRILPLLYTAHGLYPRFTKFTGYDVSAFLLIHKFMKNKADDFCPFLVNIHFAIFHIIAQHTSPEHNSLFHLPFLTPFHPLGSSTAFFLCYGGHNCKTKLCISV